MATALGATSGILLIILVTSIVQIEIGWSLLQIVSGYACAAIVQRMVLRRHLSSLKRWISTTLVAALLGTLTVILLGVAVAAMAFLLAEELLGELGATYVTFVDAWLPLTLYLLCLAGSGLAVSKMQERILRQVCAAREWTSSTAYGVLLGILVAIVAGLSIAAIWPSLATLDPQITRAFIAAMFFVCVSIPQGRVVAKIITYSHQNKANDTLDSKTTYELHKTKKDIFYISISLLYIINFFIIITYAKYLDDSSSTVKLALLALFMTIFSGILPMVWWAFRKFE